MIKLDNVNKVYTTGTVKTNALKNVSLEINQGEFVVILGQSGSGKSTLLNCISGLDTPTNGVIEVEGKKISSMSSKELTKFRRDNIGFIFQNYNLFQQLSVEENVKLIDVISENPLNASKVLDQVGLGSMKSKYPSQLSGGQQQRVSIARAVVKNPKILFGDEPTGALDEESSKEVLDVLETLNKENNTTVVVITHNPNISEMADRVITMNSGEIIDMKLNATKKSASEINW